MDSCYLGIVILWIENQLDLWDICIFHNIYALEMQLDSTYID